MLNTFIQALRLLVNNVPHLKCNPALEILQRLGVDDLKQTAFFSQTKFYFIEKLVQGVSHKIPNSSWDKLKSPWVLKRPLSLLAPYKSLFFNNQMSRKSPLGTTCLNFYPLMIHVRLSSLFRNT